MVMLVLLCQPQAVDARPLLDEAPASAVHSPAHCGVLDVLRDQEEQDEGEEGGGDDLWRDKLGISFRWDLGNKMEKPI